SDAERAQAVGRETAQVLDAITQYKRQREGLDEAQVFLELAEEGDAEALGELRDKVEQVEADLAALELKQLLGGEHDPGNAIVEIHPGAGGLEAQDWAEMLLRMYLRWRGRPARQQDRLRRPPDPPPHRHRRRLPERALAAQEQVDGDEDPEGAPLRARAREAGREDGRADEGEEGDRLRASDPLVRPASLPDGEGPPDRDGGGERGR